MHQRSSLWIIIGTYFPTDSDMRSLSLKELGHDARNTTFFLLFDAVDSVTSNTSAEGQQVHGVVVVCAVHSCWDVIDDTRLETSVTVVQQECGQGGVNHARSSASQRATDQRQHTNGNDPLRSPVVRAVRFAGLWRNVGIVHGANNVSWRLRNGLEATDQSWSEEHLLLGEQSNARNRQHVSIIATVGPRRGG